MSDYLNRTRPGDYYSITGTNVVAGSQGKVEQHNHNNAFDPSAVREFAALVQQLAPTYGMEPARKPNSSEMPKFSARRPVARTPSPDASAMPSTP